MAAVCRASSSLAAFDIMACAVVVTVHAPDAICPHGILFFAMFVTLAFIDDLLNSQKRRAEPVKRSRRSFSDEDSALRVQSVLCFPCPV